MYNAGRPSVASGAFAVTGLASLYRLAVLADNPVLYWRLGESTPTAAADEVGTYPGGYSSVTLSQPGALLHDSNTAVQFAATATSKVSIAAGTAAAFEPINVAPFSVEVWANRSTVGQTNFRGLVSQGVSVGANGGWALYMNPTGSGNTIYLVRRVAGAEVKAVAPLAAPLGAYTHAVGTYDGTNMRLYIGGSLVTTQPDARNLPVSAAPFQAGIGFATNNSFGGNLDEIAFYNYELSAGRIAAHYTIATT